MNSGSCSWPGLLALETDETGSTKGAMPDQAIVKRPLRGRLRLKRAATIAKPLRSGLNFMKSNKTGEHAISLECRTVSPHGTRVVQLECASVPPTLYCKTALYAGGTGLCGVGTGLSAGHLPALYCMKVRHAVPSATCAPSVRDALQTGMVCDWIGYKPYISYSLGFETGGA